MVSKDGLLNIIQMTKLQQSSAICGKCTNLTPLSGTSKGVELSEVSESVVAFLDKTGVAPVDPAAAAADGKAGEIAVETDRRNLLW